MKRAQRRISLLPLLSCLALSPLFGQIRPPTPVPGSPPITRNPGDDTRSIERPTKSKKNKKSTPKDELPTITAEGSTIRNNGKELLIHTADGRWITMTIDNDTKWTRGDAPITAEQVTPGSTVKVVSAEDGEANLTALTIELEKDAAPGTKTDSPVQADGADSATPPKDDASAARPPAHAAERPSDDDTLTEAKKPLDVPDAPDRPRLMRGHSVASGRRSTTDSGSTDGTPIEARPTAEAKPSAAKPEAKDNEQQDFTIGTNSPVRTASKGGPGADVLQRSMDWAESFDQGLPNYVCREVITRYAQQTRSEDWTAQDVVTANIVYQDGREQQRDITIGNKKVSDITKTGGSWSTGEFAGMLHSLFQPTRDTDFKYYRSSSIHDVETTIFDFNVVLPNSDWSIIVGGQTLRPRYSGSLWIEKNTGVVRRLEQEAKNIPKDFPMDEIQSAIEYDEVSLGTQKFLLPVRAENIACQRSTSICTKNVIEFRDYHKYAGESTIEFK